MRIKIRKDGLVKLDTPTKQIKVYGARVEGIEQDSLGRMYIWIENEES